MRHPGEMLYALAAWTTLCGTPRSGEITISPPTSTTYGRDLITRSLVNFNLDLPKTCSFTPVSRIRNFRVNHQCKEAENRARAPAKDNEGRETETPKLL